MSDEAQAVPAATPETPAAPEAAPAPEATPAAEPQQPDRYASLAAKHARTDLQLRKQTKLLKDLEAKAQRAEELEQRLTKDPFALLEERGVKWDQWTQRTLQGRATGKEDPVATLKEEIEALKGKLSEREQTEQQTAQQKAEQADREAWQQAVENTPELAFTAKLGQSNLVRDKIRAYEEKYGETSPTERLRLAMEVETDIQSTVRQQAAALAQTDGGRRMLLEILGDGQNPGETQQGQPARPGQNAAAAPKPKPKTLTNSQAAEVGTRTSSGRSEDERKRAALERLG